MTPHALKLRTRRFWRRQKQQAVASAHNAGDQFEKNFLGKLSKLGSIWKFVLAWTLLFVLLGAGLLMQLSELKHYYQILQPVPGGIYSEGLQGTFTTANPLYAVGDVDTSVSQLMFAGLLTYDGSNHLVGDLAADWSTNAAGTQYTVHLRPRLTWHDGQPLTAGDVVFTYQTIQNPDAKSPLESSWRGVQVTAPDAHTVVFTLPNPLSSFAYSLTNGIVPKHILQSVDPVDLRSASFNTANPVGAGPFRWSSLGVSGGVDNAEAEISLVPFANYWAGRPQLTSFTVHAFADRNALLAAYRNKEITTVVGLDRVPANIAHDPSSHIYGLPLTAGVFVFFKTTDPVLGDAKVRQALVAATNQTSIIARLDYPAAVLREPLLPGQLGFDPAYAEAVTNQVQASQLLDAAGWAVGPHGMRAKNGQQLTIILSITDDAEYKVVASTLKDQWRSVGVATQVITQPAADFQSNLAQHEYQAVLYGISIGADPDEFVYWDSSQADIRSTRLNFSEYKSTAVDLALEAGRARQDPSVREAKYHAFLQAWQQDAPALGLYQPKLLYISHSSVYGLGDGPINTDAGRFWNVQNWMVHLGWVTRQ